VIINVYQTGGFVGADPSPLGKIDTSTLSDAEQARVAGIMRSIESPPAGTVPMGADMIEYRIELHRDSGPDRTIVVLDDMDPNNPLVRSVRELLEIISRGR
jgi:hypothetical protein